MNERFDRRILLKAAAGFGGTLLVMPIIAACGGTGSQGSEDAALTYSYADDAETLDPGLPTSSNTMWILAQMAEPMIRIAPDGKYEGILATDWDNVDDKTWEFRLRSGVAFHNGESFDANSVKYSFDRMRQMNSPAAPFVAPIDRIEVVDDLTVRVIFTDPWADALPVIQFIVAVPPGYIEDNGNDAFAERPIGTGPYKFVEHKRGVHLKMEVNTDYWGDAPAVRDVTFRPIPEASSRIAALQNGEIDWANAIEIDRIEDLKGTNNLRVLSTPGQGIYCGLNTLNFEPFKDKRVRQAINHGVNVDSIVNDIFLGLAKRTPSVLFSSTPGYDPDMAPYSYDPTKAKQLLDEAGYTDGFEVELSAVPSQSAQKFKEVAEAIQQDLGEIGITVHVRMVDPGSSGEEYRSGRFQMYIYPWGSHVSGTYVRTLLQSDTRGYYYQSSEADEYIFEFMSAIDPTKRIEAGRRMNEFFQDECPWLFLHEEPNVYGIRDRINWEPSPYYWGLLAKDVTLP